MLRISWTAKESNRTVGRGPDIKRSIINIIGLRKRLATFFIFGHRNVVRMEKLENLVRT